MGEICARHGVLVISDEIHQDLIINPARKHVPFASLGSEFARNSITCTAPSKTFNLPGLQSANVFVPDRRLREELARQYERNLFPLVNVLGMVAAEAAYTHGEPWLKELLTYLRGNHAHFAQAVNNATTKVRVLPADSLYLAEHPGHHHLRPSARPAGRPGRGGRRQLASGTALLPAAPPSTPSVGVR